MEKCSLVMMVTLSKFKILQIWITPQKQILRLKQMVNIISNTAPEITSSDTGTVVENADISAVIYTATATDADSDTITWS